VNPVKKCKRLDQDGFDADIILQDLRGLKIGSTESRFTLRKRFLDPKPEILRRFALQDLRIKVGFLILSIPMYYPNPLE